MTKGCGLKREGGNAMPDLTEILDEVYPEMGNIIIVPS